MTIRTTLDKPYLKRPFRPLYGWTQMTPKAMLLDPAWDRSVNIWPGMVAMKTTGDNVTLINGTGVPYGFFGEYIGGDGIDEPLLRGINTMTVWVLDDGGEAEVLSPSFDTTLTWTDPGNGTLLLAYAYTTGANRGRLCLSGTSGATSKPVARVLKIATNKLVVGGLSPIDT
jgi:hypothetical protein